MMTAIDREKLRRVALDATAGPWRVGVGAVVVHDTLGKVCEVDTDIGLDLEAAKFIAAWNPTQALALLDRLEALEEVASAAKTYWPNIVELCACAPEYVCDYCALGKALAALDGANE